MRSCLPPIPHPRLSASKSPVPAPAISRFHADVLPGKTSHGVFRSSRNWLRSSRFPARSRVKDSGFTQNVLRCNGDGENSSVFEPGNQRKGTSDAVAFDFLELKRELEKEEKEERGVGSVGSSEEEEEEEEVVLPEISGKANLESEEEEEEEEERVGRIVRRKVVGRGRQTLKRSSLLAKQVISMRSACCLGFISQLWVDTTSWMVVVIEVRPSILSGENDKFLLKDVCQVGDVVLVQDESVIENDLRMIGLDTLVGYNVVTSGRRNVGKVRGYNFNINSGAVESLELDSFGMSILPSSLVSTFSLLIEDVLEAVPDTIVVQDDAISRVQRLTKGFWGTQSVAFPTDDIEEYTEFRRPGRHVDGNRRRRTKFRDFPSRTREIDDGWDLPMEY